MGNYRTTRPNPRAAAPKDRQASAGILVTHGASGLDANNAAG